MMTKIPQQLLEIDAGLDAASRRLMARGRALFGVEELTADTAVAAAENVARHLASLAPAERLVRQREIAAVIDDLQALNDRLRRECSAVGNLVVERSRHRAGRNAYVQGAKTCRSK